MKKIWLLKISLGLQIAMFVWASAIEAYYARFHYGDMAILGSILPDLLFLILGVANLGAMIGYSLVVWRRKQTLDPVIVGLCLVLLIVSVLYLPISQWIISG